MAWNFMQRVARRFGKKTGEVSDSLDRDIAYAVNTFEGYLRRLPGPEQDPRGKMVLEAGPGSNLAVALLWACHGARAAVVDRFLAPFDESVHRPLYERLLGWLETNRPGLDPEPVRRVLDQGRYPGDVVVLHSCALEELKIPPGERADITVSNAVLEHMYDFNQAARSLAGASKPGAVGLHQVDFRDHRDFSRPLEYLLLSREEFLRMFHERNGECGNRLRPREMDTALVRAGFEIRDFEANMFAGQAYLDEFLPRLRRSGMSEYREWDAPDLSVTSGMYTLHRGSGPSLAQH